MMGADWTVGGHWETTTRPLTGEMVFYIMPRTLGPISKTNCKSNASQSILIDEAYRMRAGIFTFLGQMASNQLTPPKRYGAQFLIGTVAETKAKKVSPHS